MVGFQNHLNIGEARKNRRELLLELCEMQYQRNDIEFTRGCFRVRGDTRGVSSL